MATNVSALRVKILGDGSGLDSTLSQSSKRVSAFASSVRQSASQVSTAAKAFGFGDSLGRELSKVRQQIESAAGAYVGGAKVSRAELEQLVAAEKRLQGQIQARQALLNSLRGTGPDLAEIGPSAVSRRAGRTIEEQLTGVRARMRDVAGEYQRLGMAGGHQLDRLAKLENRLSAAIDARNAMLAQSRAAYQAVGTSAATAATRAGMAPGSGGWAMIGTTAAYGLQDALAAGQYGGLRGAASAAANNLPMLGVGVSTVAAQLAAGTSRAAGFAAVLARFAGPAGLVASVALPLGAMLVPKLLQAGDAADKTKLQFRELEQQWDRMAAARAALGLEFGKGGRVGPAFQTAEQWGERRAALEEELDQLKGDVDLAAGRLEQVLGTRIAPGAVKDFMHELRTADPREGASVFRRWDDEQRRIAAPLFGDDDPRRQKVLDLEAKFFDARLGHARRADERMDVLVGEDRAKRREAAYEVFVAPMLRAAEFKLDDFMGGVTRASDRKRAMRESLASRDALAPAMNYGSREALSAVSRAAFSQRDKAEAETAKNTAATVRGVDKLIGVVKGLQGLALVPGPPIP